MTSACSFYCVSLVLCCIQNVLPVLTNDNPPPVVIRGQNEFVPCTYELDPSELRAHILYCDEEASREFGNQLPIIQADQIPLSEIRIRGTLDITICPDNAFKEVNLDVDRARGHLGSVVRRVDIIGTRLTHIEPHCLDGLFTVKELRILNVPGSEDSGYSEELSRNLFLGLQGLRNLECLQLVHVDLSGGIPAHGLGNWTEELRLVKLEQNRLSSIDSDAFLRTGMRRSMLHELRIEGQPEAWQLIRNMPRWASGLISLRTLSWQRSQLQPPIEEGILRMDLGEEANSKLVTLILDDCGLVRLVTKKSGTQLAGLSLDALGPYLRELSANRNNFASLESLDQSLAGLSIMSQLQLLRIEYNKTPLNRLPDWFSNSDLNQLRELRLRKSGLTTIMANAFPPQLERLHLSANPLRYVDADWMGNNQHGLLELHLNHIRLASVDVAGRWADWAGALKPIAGTLQVLSLSGCQIEPDVLALSVMKSQNRQTSNTSTAGTTTRLKVHLGLNNLKQLRTLVLSDNDLTYIPADAFRGLHHLKHLILAGNQLGSMRPFDPTEWTNEPQGFAARQRLQRLDIRFNQFQTLNRCERMFGLEKPLEEVLPQRPIWLLGESNTNTADHYAVGLRLSDIPDDHIVGPKEWYGGLSLTGNQFVCDCRLSWLRLHILQMDRHVTMKISGRMLPVGYENYRTEALDFVCADQGPWRGRKFLTLKPTDLYAVRHEQCQKHPEIYGDGMQIERALIPCREVLQQLSPSSEIRPRSRMNMLPSGPTGALGSSLLRDPNGTKVITGKKNNIDNMGISLEAFVLVIVASAASLCFVIVSIIIVIWLCLRLKRQENWQKSSSYVRGRYSRGQQRGNPFADLCTSQCCSGRTRHSAGTSVTLNSSGSTARTTILRHFGAPHQPRNIMVESEYGPGRVDLSDTGTVYEDAVESYYSQMSDPEYVISSDAVCSSNRSRPNTLKRKKRHQSNTHQQHVEMIDLNKRNSHEVRINQGVSQTVKEDRDSSSNEVKNDKKSLVSLDQDYPPPRVAPLPPIPAPRKTKSTADIHTDLVIHERKEPTGTKDELSLPSSYEPRSPEHAVSLNELAKQVRGSLIRTDYSDSRDYLSSAPRLRNKPRPEASVTNRHTDGSVRSFESDESEAFKRTRLTQSIGTHNLTPILISSKKKSPGWIRRSRRKLERSFDWLRRTACGNGGSTTTKDSGLTVFESRGENKVMDDQLRIQEDEDSRCIQGPDLPRPRIVLIPKILKPIGPGPKPKQSHEYLSMQNQVVSLESTTGTNKLDEYVTELAKHPVEMVHRNTLKHQPSHSDGGAEQIPSVIRRHPVRLSDNLYTISLYEDAPESPACEPKETLELDLPPPPPPPPPKMIVNSPQTAWARPNVIKHQPVSPKPRSPSADAKRNTPHSERISGQAINSSKLHQKRPPPPVRPKPRDAERAKALTSMNGATITENTANI
ncbi:hypothetical protein D915_002065 [Fasciola hepatica]|uniref:Leucine Rich repeat-containing domain protein n=1 Tax=Fasciola hepatica TaxID=6192 RepID=A0A4E0RWK4_FASHE|nr:hypothetical protein D915_002065 [Fasciola hepatica]